MASARNSMRIPVVKAAIFYYNPSDSALMVPKRSGFGYTLNFGRPVAWFLLAAMLALPLLLPLLFRGRGQP